MFDEKQAEEIFQMLLVGSCVEVEQLFLRILELEQNSIESHLETVFSSLSNTKKTSRFFMQVTEGPFGIKIGAPN